MATTTALTAARTQPQSWSFAGFFARFVGPAALTAAGMIGAGAVVKQDLARIDEAIADGSFFENEALLAVFRCYSREPGET